MSDHSKHHPVVLKDTVESGEDEIENNPGAVYQEHEIGKRGSKIIELLIDRRLLRNHSKFPNYI